MNNKEKFRRTFGTLHASDDFLMEVTQMNARKQLSTRRLVSICAAAIVIFAMATVAYANDLGGIRRTIQLWIRGRQTSVVWESENGRYKGSYQDKWGFTHHIGGGGVTLDENGNERPMTEDELLDKLDRPEVEYQDNGTVWVYYRGQSIEITDRFDENGVCFLLLEENGENLYLTIKYRGGFACRTDNYMPPEQFYIGK